MITGRLRVAWALGGGGARGLAHLGVLRVLEREGIPIDFLAGTSMGAVVAAAYSAGGSLKYLTQLAERINWEHLFDLRFPRLGLIGGQRIISVVKLLSKNKKLEELDPPVWITATDLLTGDEVIFKTGEVELAVRSSISIPGVFTPVRHNGKLLVDGGVVANVPVKAARQMGADLVIGVDVSAGPNPLPPRNFVEILLKTMDIMGSKLNQSQIKEADLVIKVEILDVGAGQFHRAADCIRKGEEAALRYLSQIRALLKTGGHPGRDLEEQRGPGGPPPEKCPAGLQEAQARFTS